MADKNHMGANSTLEFAVLDEMRKFDLVNAGVDRDVAVKLLQAGWVNLPYLIANQDRLSNTND